MALTTILAAALAIAALLGVAATYTPPPGARTGDKGDLATYDHIVGRMRAGEGYYAAAHGELIARGYGTRSVFNWRLPILSWLASLAPHEALADGILRLCALAAAIVAAVALGQRAGWLTAAIALPALGWSLVTAATPGVAVFADVVAGVLILASVAAYGLRWPIVAAVIALAALFVRELSAPFVGICVLFAWRERRTVELGVWAAGIAAFAAYFAWHVTKVHALLGPTDFAYPDGWLRFGGLQFILATAAFNGFSIAAPMWLSAVLLPLCLMGLAAWKDDMSWRAAAGVVAYLLLFAVVGKPANDYWGALYTPIMMLGVPFLPAAFHDLFVALRRPQ